MIAVFSLTAATTGQQQVRPQESLVQRYDKAIRLVAHYDHKIHPCKSTKPYLVRKRNATWKWQDQIYIPRTRTSFAEKRTHGCKYLRWLAQRWASRANEAFQQYVDLKEPKAAICHIFGVYCSEALAVSGCETGNTYDIKAQNGQYLGLFQMGSSERARYGHGYTPLEQAISAHRYFVDSGRDWSPWSCQP